MKKVTNSFLDACAVIEKEELEKEMLEECEYQMYMQEWLFDYEEEKENERLEELKYESMYQDWVAEYEKEHPSRRYVYTFDEQKRLISNYENDYNRRIYYELFVKIVDMLKNGYDFQTIDEKVYSFIKNRQINGVCGCFGCVFGWGSPLDNLKSKFTNTHYVSYNTYEFDLEASDRIRRITYGILDCMNYCNTLKNKDINRVFGNTFFELEVLECSEHNYYKSGYRLQYYMFGVYLYRTFFENFAYKMRNEIRDYHDFLIDEYFC